MSELFELLRAYPGGIDALDRATASCGPRRVARTTLYAIACGERPIEPALEALERAYALLSRHEWTGPPVTRRKLRDCWRAARRRYLERELRELSA